MTRAQIHRLCCQYPCFSVSLSFSYISFFISAFSSNGTYINHLLIGRGNRIEIKHNDEISIGGIIKEGDEMR